MTCAHPKAKRREGPREPMRYGTGPTEICTKCGATRNTLHVPGPWRLPLGKTYALVISIVELKADGTRRLVNDVESLPFLATSDSLAKCTSADDVLWPSS